MTNHGVGVREGLLQGTPRAGVPDPSASSSSPWGDRLPFGADVTGHVRDLARYAVPALAVALVAAVVVGAWRAGAEPVHRATTTAVVEVGSAGDTGNPEDAQRLAATFAAAADDPEVLVGAARGTGWTAAQTAAHVTVTTGETPGVLQVSVLASTDAEARRVAAAVPTALQTAVRAERAAVNTAWTDDLRAQLDDVRTQLAAAEPGSAQAQQLATDADVRYQQLSRLERAEPPGLVQPAAPVVAPGRVSPQPLRDASLAFVLVALVVAELAALLAGRRGPGLGRGAARRTARRGQGRLVEVPRGTAGTADLLPLRAAVGEALATGRHVVVLTGPGVTRGEAAALVAGSGSGTGRLVVADLQEPWWQSVDAPRVALAAVVAAAGSPVRGRAQEAAASLADSGAVVHVVLLSAGATQAAAPAAARTDRSSPLGSRPGAARVRRLAGSVPMPARRGRPAQQPSGRPRPPVGTAPRSSVDQLFSER